MRQREDESNRLSIALNNKIVEVLRGSSPVPVLEEGTVNSRRLQKARLRISIALSACLASGSEMPDCANSVSETEMQRAALTIAHAILNPYHVDWDVERYGESVKSPRPNDDGLPTGEPERLRKYFGRADLGRISEPATIVDRHGNIVTIYLPNILSPSRVQHVNEATQGLRKQLLRTLPNSSVTDAAWRSTGFCVPNGGGTFGAGRITISPAYFMQRQERMQDPLVTSASYSSAEIQAWLAALSTTEFFWNAITNAVAPELFKAGAAAISGALNKVRSNSKTSSSTVSQWPSIFSGLELIANRVTLSHRDGGGAPTLYDLLVSLGIGHNATMKLADLQAELDYSPGTMVYISGRVLEHSVGPWDNGERFVIAHFMRDKVHDRIGVPRPQFPKHTTLLEMVGKEVARNRKKFGH